MYPIHANGNGHSMESYIQARRNIIIIESKTQVGMDTIWIPKYKCEGTSYAFLNTNRKRHHRESYIGRDIKIMELCNGKVHHKEHYIQMGKDMIGNPLGKWKGASYGVPQANE